MTGNQVNTGCTDVGDHVSSIEEVCDPELSPHGRKADRLRASQGQVAISVQRNGLEPRLNSVYDFSQEHKTRGYDKDRARCLDYPVPMAQSTKTGNGLVAFGAWVPRMSRRLLSPDSPVPEHAQRATTPACIPWQSERVLLRDPRLLAARGGKEEPRPEKVIGEECKGSGPVAREYPKGLDGQHEARTCSPVSPLPRHSVERTEGNKPETCARKSRHSPAGNSKPSDRSPHRSSSQRRTRRANRESSNASLSGNGDEVRHHGLFNNSLYMPHKWKVRNTMIQLLEDYGYPLSYVALRNKLNEMGILHDLGMSMRQFCAQGLATGVYSFSRQISHKHTLTFFALTRWSPDGAKVSNSQSRYSENLGHAETTMSTPWHHGASSRDMQIDPDWKPEWIDPADAWRPGIERRTGWSYYEQACRRRSRSSSNSSVPSYRERSRASSKWKAQEKRDYDVYKTKRRHAFKSESSQSPPSDLDECKTPAKSSSHPFDEEMENVKHCKRSKKRSCEHRRYPSSDSDTNSRNMPLRTGGKGGSPASPEEPGEFTKRVAKSTEDSKLVVRTKAVEGSKSDKVSRRGEHGKPIRLAGMKEEYGPNKTTEVMRDSKDMKLAEMKREYESGKTTKLTGGSKPVKLSKGMEGGKPLKSAEVKRERELGNMANVMEDVKPIKTAQYTGGGKPVTLAEVKRERELGNTVNVMEDVKPIKTAQYTGGGKPVKLAWVDGGNESAKTTEGIGDDKSFDLARVKREHESGKTAKGTRDCSKVVVSKDSKKRVSQAEVRAPLERVKTEQVKNEIFVERSEAEEAKK